MKKIYCFSVGGDVSAVFQESLNCRVGKYFIFIYLLLEVSNEMMLICFRLSPRKGDKELTNAILPKLHALYILINKVNSVLDRRKIITYRQ